MEVRLPADAPADALLNPSGHFNYGLNSVSCASAGNCTAIGVYEDGGLSPHGMLLTETHGSWGRGVEARVP